MYTNIRTLGIKETENNTPFPTLATLKAGASGTILDTDIAKIGLGLDISVPCFQNFIAEFNAQVAFKKAFYISIGEKFNMAEVINGKYGNGEVRKRKLGAEYKEVQNKVNEIKGCSFRYKI